MVGRKLKLILDFTKKLAEFDVKISVAETSRRIGILGESGSGKSITLKSIAGIVTPDTGLIQLEERVFFDSRRNVNVKPQQRKVGYLFQNYALFPTMTVAENIAVSLKGTRSEIARRVRELVQKFRLDGLEDRYPANLSGGQQQRTALARLMAYEPRMILLDEPFSAMDSFLKDRLQEEMAEFLHGYDGTMVMVSHNRDEIYRFCDELLVIDRGQIIRCGRTEDVFADPRAKHAAYLTGCKNYSDLERIDAHHAHLVDWGIDITTDREIPEGTVCFGYRAHDFVPVWGARTVNCLPVSLIHVAELPFERNYYLRPGGMPQPHNPEFISWFVQRSRQAVIEERGLPGFLRMMEESMLFLSDTGK
jgi:molybdate transport system ATP-binding protein